MFLDHPYVYGIKQHGSAIEVGEHYKSSQHDEHSFMFHKI